VESGAAREREPERDLGYLGAYALDRQPALERALVHAAIRWPAGRFLVAGDGYPTAIGWPRNVERAPAAGAAQRAELYASQRCTLVLARAGWSPSARLLEAAASGVPVISDWWEGLDSFLRIGAEVLVTASPETTLAHLREIDAAERRAIGARARPRVLREHSPERRAEELDAYVA
jgi:spore maturation protein CgeB